MRIPELAHSPIDMHSHFNHGVPNETTESEIYACDLGFLKQAYEALDIHQVAFSSFAAVLKHPECICAENVYLREQAAQNDWMYQWTVIDPRQPETFRQADDILKDKKCLGIKIHSVSHEYDITQYADEIFSFANERRATVLMHPDQIEKMADFVNQYPNMTLIIAHLCGVEHMNAVRDAKYGNIWVDTSGWMSTANRVVEEAVNRVGSERILFGTDTYSGAFQLGRILLSTLSDAEKENILYRNAMRLCPGKFDEKEHAF